METKKNYRKPEFEEIKMEVRPLMDPTEAECMKG